FEEGTEHTVGVRPGQTAAKLSAVPLILAVGTILMAVITGEALFPAAYTTSHYTISDLRSTWQPGNIVREPSATTSSTAMLVAGLMTAVAAACFWRAYRSRSVSIALLLFGIGLFGVGIFRGTESRRTRQHLRGAPARLDAHLYRGGLAAVLAYRVTTSPFRTCLSSSGSSRC
ncbi:MAG: DUF998 domain-containing protein, partial [Actinomycetota bacterium]|nr:DUF998 domain-containing protein [Actinomycetota bacterium]